MSDGPEPPHCSVANLAEPTYCRMMHSAHGEKNSRQFYTSLKRICFTVLVLGGFLDQASVAAETFTAPYNLTIFTEPNSSSPKLGILKKGKKVEILQRGKRWTQVWVRVSGKKVRGHFFSPETANVDDSSEDMNVDTGDIENQTLSSERFTNPWNHWRLAVMVLHSLYSQPSRTFTDTTGSQTDISDLKGSNTHYAIYGEWPVTETIYLRAGLTQRNLTVTGTAKYRSIVPSASSEVEIKQEFVGVTAGGRYTLGLFWLGGFLELGNSTKSTVLGAEADKPSYFFLHASGGLEYKFTRQIFLSLELRPGFVINSKPMILVPETSLAAGFEF